VVSDRAIKHVHELTCIHQAGVCPQTPAPASAAKQTKARSKQQASEAEACPMPAANDSPEAARCAVLFVVNRSDCTSFRPCHEADMLFAQVVKRAQEQGGA
jgi:DNA-binding sugar fermentation-stimulating protein